jgi:hypothetical protein
MAPEQTGRMNRSIDSAATVFLGVTLQMLTGSLPSPQPIRWSGCTAISPKPAPPSAAENVPAGFPDHQKLLAKMAEERYQTRPAPRGTCGAVLPNGASTASTISRLANTAADRLLIPRAVREAREVETLLASLPAIAGTGANCVAVRDIPASANPVTTERQGAGTVSGLFDRASSTTQTRCPATFAGVPGPVRPLLGKTTRALG